MFIWLNEAKNKRINSLVNDLKNIKIQYYWNHIFWIPIKKLLILDFVISKISSSK